MASLKHTICVRSIPACVGRIRHSRFRFLRAAVIQAVLMVALVPACSYGTARIDNLVATKHGTENDADNHNDGNDSRHEWSSAVASFGYGPCAFAVRYVQALAIDRKTGGQSEEKTFKSNYKVEIHIAALPGEEWKLHLFSHRKGDVNIRDDNGRAGRAQMFSVSWTPSSPSGSEDYTVSGSLAISSEPFASNAPDDGGDPQEPDNEPIDDEVGPAIVTGKGPASLSFEFDWQAYARSIAVIAGGDEAAVRLGKALDYVNIPAGTYPGDPARNDISADGHFVTGYLEEADLSVPGVVVTSTYNNGCVISGIPPQCTFHVTGTVNCLGENFDIKLTFRDEAGNIICEKTISKTGVTDNTFDETVTCDCPPVVDPPLTVDIVITNTPGKSGDPTILASGTFPVVEAPCVCYAEGDVNGDGVILTVSDLVDLIRFVDSGGPPPNPLYQGDLNSDGYIDQADIDAYKCYFIYGSSCFPVFPVPTTCNPDTVRGCCCSATGCAIRSLANCTAAGGTYKGDGTLCCHRICIDTVRTLNGLTATIPIVRADASLLVGGFDLLVSYDASALTFLSASTGLLLDSLEWEYFTYRTGAGGNCTGGCPNGLVRLIAIADLDNGPSQHPVVSAEPGELAILRFQVTGDRNFIGQCIPVRFFWNDCGDNVFSSVSGDTTYVDQSISSPDGSVLWDEEDDVQFPESARPQGLGAPDFCLIGGGPGKPLPERRICFRNGWVCINEPPDDRGDLNLNGIANEIGDAVLYTNYFVYGSSVWSPPYQDVQLLASDVNDDGVVLTVADLIYLIRIITGDEQPFPPGGNPKMTPYANFGSATVRTESDRLIVSTTSPVDVGGAWLIFRYSGITIGGPALLDAASGMNLRYNAEAGELRVLVHPSWDGDFASVGTGSHDILTIPTTGDGTIELVEVQMSDARGALLSTVVAKSFVPKSYALLQNYPNPFNAGTVIAFDLIENADWDLTIYNVLGQAIRRFEGNNDAGRVSVTWDGRTEGGNSASSGVYLYRISANGFTATKKMTLVK